MKRIVPFAMTAVISTIAFALVIALSVSLPSISAAAESQPKVVSVDYVLALMDAGIDQRDIIRRITDRHLTFRLEPGDIDRLREAGAGEGLIAVVSGEAESGEWERPQRLATETEGTNGEGIQEVPDSGYGAAPGYGYYAPGYSSFYLSYGYPYYYGYPYAYPYPYYYYPSHYYYGYGKPYCSYPYSHNHGGSYRTVPRGTTVNGAPPPGGSRPIPRSYAQGSNGGYRSAPQGGSAHMSRGGYGHMSYGGSPRMSHGGYARGPHGGGHMSHGGFARGSHGGFGAMNHGGGGGHRGASRGRR